MSKQLIQDSDTLRYLNQVSKAFAQDSKIVESISKQSAATQRHAQVNGLEASGNTKKMSMDHVQELIQDHDTGVQKQFFDTSAKNIAQMSYDHQTGQQSDSSASLKISKAKGMVHRTEDGKFRPFLGVENQYAEKVINSLDSSTSINFNPSNQGAYPTTVTEVYTPKHWEYLYSATTAELMIKNKVQWGNWLTENIPFFFMQDNLVTTKTMKFYSDDSYGAQVNTGVNWMSVAPFTIEFALKMGDRQAAQMGLMNINLLAKLNKNIMTSIKRIDNDVLWYGLPWIDGLLNSSDAFYDEIPQADDGVNYQALELYNIFLDRTAYYLEIGLGNIGYNVEVMCAVPTRIFKALARLFPYVPMTNNTQLKDNFSGLTIILAPEVESANSGLPNDKMVMLAHVPDYEPFILFQQEYMSHGSQKVLSNYMEKASHTFTGLVLPAGQFLQILNIPNPTL